MIYNNNNNVVQNIYERPATGGRTERSPSARTLNRDRDCCVEKLTQHPFNRSSKIQKLNEGNIDSLSNSGQDYNGCFVR